MSPYAQRSAQRKRLVFIGIVVFVVLVCAAIGFAQWWSYNVTLPAYQRVDSGR